jgi:hypothetical protein
MLFSGSTNDFWAWTIRPDMSAFWVGAGYTFGAVAITTMLLVGRWRASIVPVVSTLPFAVVMLAATLIHHDRFFEGSARYYVWLAIYAYLPFALPAMLVLNLGRDPGPDAEDILLPASIRTVLVVGGLPVGVLGLVLAVAPHALASSWPWMLTPLMSRVIGGWLLFIAAGSLCPLFECRYVAYRFYLPTAAFWFSLLLAGSFIHRDDFDWDRIMAPLFVVAVAAAIAAIVAISLRMELVLRDTRTPRAGSVELTA